VKGTDTRRQVLTNRPFCRFLEAIRNQPDQVTRGSRPR